MICFCQQKHQQYKLLRNKHDIDVMRNYDVIGLTVTGAAMRANLLGKPTELLFVFVFVCFTST